MAKRFTDTNKFRSPFYRGLPAPYKLLWDLVNLDCDHAGLWIVDFEIAQIYTGKDAKIDEEKALAHFNTGEVRVIPIENGKIWFILPFFSEQYGKLNASNRVHASVISSWEKHGIDFQNLEYLKLEYEKEGATMPLTSPLQGAKDKDKDKDKDKEMDKEGGAGGSLYKDAMTVYHDFVKLRTGVPPNINAIEGKALKTIIVYLRGIDRNDEKIIEAWKAVLNNFDKWDAFLQRQLKLSQISSNLTNIIHSIKNGKQTNARREITNEDIAAEVRKRYPDSVR